VLRRDLEEWFGDDGLRPRIVAEVDDSGLATVLSEKVQAVFAAPDVVEKDILRRYQVRLVGRAKGLRQRFYAISVERKLKHPAVVAICNTARDQIFNA
jgi:LysR family transcriptional activator of nhaA